jgi:type IV secretory pathway VirD2 relaxase
MQDEFEPKLGKVSHGRAKRDTPYVRKVLNAAYKHGFAAKRKSAFTGKYIGRGSAVGTLAAAGFFPKGQRRVLVKVRIAKLRAGDLSAPRAHLRYLQRDGVTRDGESGQVYSKDLDIAEAGEFTERCDGDRHQFRIIVSPEDAAQMEALKPFVRDLMSRMERDLDTELDWVAVDHFNTGHPHSHIIIRGHDDLGKDLIMTRDYVSHGIRHQAQDLVTLELGPELEFDRQMKMAREVDAERFTRLDRTLLAHAQDNFLVVSTMPPADTMTHAAQMGRLRKLQSYGLAQEKQTGVWELSPNTETRLKALGQRHDIINTMHGVMREAGIDRPAGSFSIYHGEKPVVGKVAAIGLADELSDRRYVVIDGTDGRVHYADLGNVKPELLPERGMIAALHGQSQETASTTVKEKQRARIQVLSYRNLERLVAAEGLTWLDQELASKSSTFVSDQGFGSDVKSALRNRLQWLTERGMVDRASDDGIRPSAIAMKKLAKHDVTAAAQTYSVATGLHAAQLMDGERFEGTYTKPITLASGKYAVFENSKEFTLVPWRPSFEDIRGKSVTGKVTGSTIAWELAGRTRGLGI